MLARTPGGSCDTAILNLAESFACFMNRIKGLNIFLGCRLCPQLSNDTHKRFAWCLSVYLDIYIWRRNHKSVNQQTAHTGQRTAGKKPRLASNFSKFVMGIVLYIPYLESLFKFYELPTQPLLPHFHHAGKPATAGQTGCTCGKNLKGTLPKDIQRIAVSTLAAFTQVLPL